MKIGIVLRKDAPKKGGGDLIQANAYAKLLEMSGWEVVRSYGRFPDDFSLRGVFVFNIDRPIDSVATIREAKRRRIPIILVPIHHSRRFVDEYQRKFSSLLERSCRSVFRSFHHWEVAKDCVRVIQGKAPLQGLIPELVHGQLSIQRWMLDSVDGIIYNTLSERNAIEEEIGVAGKPNIIIHNGFNPPASTSAFSRPDWLDFVKRYKRFVLMAGRIEPRKNQLGVLQALQGLGIPICFVGAQNSFHKGYYKLFKEQVARQPHCLYLGSVSPTEMSSLYEKAWVHISASWFEVCSIVDIEARCCGCHVVSTSRSYVLDYAADFAKVCDPERPFTITDNIKAALSSERPGLPGEAFLRRFSWDSFDSKLNQFVSSIVSI